MSNHRNIMDIYLVDLCDLTQCNEILLDTCTERRVITRTEKDIIGKEEILFQRNRKLYTIIRSKDEGNFQKLVQIMKEESTAQSGDVLNILERNRSIPSTQKCPRPKYHPAESEERNLWLNVHDHFTSFVGRENELKELHEMVTRNADKDTQVAVMSLLTSVSESGGIGKTALAREYAKRFASYFHNIIWINAETTCTTEESFRELADDIGDENRAMGRPNEKAVPFSLSTWDTYEYFSKRKCLFVFDNVDDFKRTVALFIPKSYEPGKIRPYVLMTSRKQRLVDDCKVFRLDVLQIEDAEKLIKSKLQKSMGQIQMDESVRKLANELQCFPLALQQAVAYIQNQVRLKSFLAEKERNHIEEYLKLLEQNPKVPISQAYQDETMDDYAYTVMRTLGITLKAIERERYGDQAIEVMEMLSYFPPQNIPIDHFNTAFTEEELEHSGVILEQYSLINRVGIDGKCINIHRLVQQVIRVQNMMNERKGYLIGECLTLVAKYPKNYNYIDNHYIYWTIWKHSLVYENLVIEYQSILEKFFQFSNIQDLEILNSSLEILEKNPVRDDLMDMYYTFISTTLEMELRFGDVPDWLAQKAMTRLNSLFQNVQDTSIWNILSTTSSWIRDYSVIRTPKFLRDILLAITTFCDENSTKFAEDIHLSFMVIEIWLKLKELRQCRKCFQLLVLKYGVDSEYYMREGYHNFNFFSKYLIQLASLKVKIADIDKKEREFVRELLDFSRSAPLDTNEIGRLDKVHILHCNILCLLLLNDNNFVNFHEIESCVFKISVQMKNEFIDRVEKTDESELYAHYYLKGILEDVTFTLNNIVIIRTTSLISSEWVQYFGRIVKLIGTWEKILELKLEASSYTSCLIAELESTVCELEDCCRLCVDIAETN